MFGVKHFAAGFLPSSILGNKGVGEDDELSGDCDESDLGFFAILHQPIVKWLERGVPLLGTDGGEIKHSSHRCPTSPDNPFAIMFAGAVGDRCEAGEHGDPFVGQCTELGEADNQRCRHGWPMPGIEITIS